MLASVLDEEARDRITAARRRPRAHPRALLHDLPLRLLGKCLPHQLFRQIPGRRDEHEADDAFGVLRVMLHEVTQQQQRHVATSARPGDDLRPRRGLPEHDGGFLQPIADGRQLERAFRQAMPRIVETGEAEPRSAAQSASAPAFVEAMSDLSPMSQRMPAPPESRAGSER